ncbi:hypothetical protein WH87_05450 [Devosia epidermidihirudinis]|uniref:DUF3329 domain-containing protein n=1 Tax=Devosia epidermidihirudinis TaxID=1293439 RepID=A0A0F5QF55_9HYPH|nr:hypothetical protein [Devosia epidermidihirudinis]KKC39607.1 hypothetical protein WH87_05450 [Devosia epidermidihirudinis]
MALKQNDLNWFRPLWRRVAVTGFLAVWTAWEFLWTKDQFWGLLVAAALAYSLYNFFYAFPKEEPANVEPTEPARPTEGEDGPRS